MNVSTSLRIAVAAVLVSSVRLRAGVAPRGDRRHVDGATREPTRNRPADHRRCR